MTQSTAPAPATRSVPCPTCGGASLYSSSNPFRPFCSERCKSTDFGAWASEAYRMPAAPPIDASVDEDTGPRAS